MVKSDPIDTLYFTITDFAVDFYPKRLLPEAILTNQCLSIGRFMDKCWYNEDTFSRSSLWGVYDDILL